jgi:hypothetical protein
MEIYTIKSADVELEYWSLILSLIFLSLANYP